MSRLRQWASPDLCLLVAGFAAVQILAFAVPAVADADTRATIGFLMLQSARTVQLAHGIVNSVNPAPFVALAGVCVLVGLIRRRPSLAGVALATCVGANLSTELIKHAVAAHPLRLTGPLAISTGSFPSGHATAAMSLMASAVVVCPPRLRRAALPLGALYVIAVGYGALLLENHYPSDVIGGYLMAAVWATLALTARRVVLGHREAEPTERVQFGRRGAGSGAVWMVWVLALAMAGAALDVIEAPRETIGATVLAAALSVGVVGVAGASAVGRVVAATDDGTVPRTLARVPTNRAMRANDAVLGPFVD